MIRSRLRRQQQTTENVVLLGDSILDNKHYVAKGEPDVAGHLLSLAGPRRVTLLARDGAVTGTLGGQLKRIPHDATRLVVSVGGNNAMQHIGILSDGDKRTMAESLDELSWMREEFEADYHDALGEILDLGIPVSVCTIYDCDFPEPAATCVRAALALFNDVIIRYAFLCHLPVIDLRQVMTDSADYELNIEPSGPGGAKIAQAIAASLGW